KEFAEKEANFTKPIGEKLKKIIDELGKSGGYVLILPKEMILYALPGDDLTETIIKKYNSGK
ncbi:MAG: OmpH family outer membrane protein, partial [Deltaproteobacteria bacterium]|nr:OmpH family outer membrane protein [Deltaproteobacteria bacterium]